MSREQIEEMAKVIEQSGMLDSYSRCEVVADELYNADYRKQSEGEWGFDGMSWTCSECGEYATKGIKTDFCPNCGARMKGGAK